METALAIYNSYWKTKSKTHVILGPRSQDLLLPLLPFYPYEDALFQSRLDIKDYFAIESDPTQSFILESIDNVMIQIASKINTLLIRDCRQLTINLEGGSIGGITIINSETIHMAEPIFTVSPITSYQSRYIYINGRQIVNQQ